jgi:protein-disulfide isomerase
MHPYPRSGQALLAVLIVLCMFASIGASYYFSRGGGGEAEVIAKRVMELQRQKDIDAVGGQANYDLKAETEKYSLLTQKDQMVAFVKQAKQQLGEEKLVTTPEKIAEIKKTAYISGNPDGRFLVLEYSDLECPFCIHQAKQGTIQQLMDSFSGQVAYSFRSFRGANHAGTETKGRAALCVGEVGGADKYMAFAHAIFQGSDETTNTVYPVADLSKLAGQIGVDTAKYDACMADGHTLAKFNAETNEGSGFGVTGTPGTVIIDTKTNQYALVGGALPVAQFISKIQGFLAN